MDSVMWSGLQWGIVAIVILGLICIVGAIFDGMDD